MKLLVALSVAFVLMTGIPVARADQPTNQTTFFLPKNPVAAAYVLRRLSNQELINAPRSEAVYVALLQRAGLERRYRIEALDGLSKIRQDDRLGELLLALGELDKKGGESADPLNDLTHLLLEFGPAELAVRRQELARLALSSQLAQVRQMAYAALASADGSVESSWEKTKSNPDQLADLIAGLSLVHEPVPRKEIYARVEPFLQGSAAPELRRAAMRAAVTAPGHEAETFRTLAKLVQAGVDTGAAIASLQLIPQSAWPEEAIAPLAQSLVGYLQKVPTGQRTEDAFGSALQFTGELAARLPSEEGRKLRRTLRDLGPTVVTLHAVYEQMRFDKQLIVVEAGKPVAIIVQNDDAMPHNLAILAPGALEEIGLAAEKMTPEADAEGRLYIPASPKVLHATKLAAVGQRIQLAFTAPVEIGEYPYVCTFPGHWRRMAGTLAVVQDVDAYLASHEGSLLPKITEWKLSDLTSDLTRAGSGRDLEGGRELFTKLACAQCHKLGPRGYAYGPELTDVFKRYKNDRAGILQQILEPSKVIEDRYRNFTFELNNGDSLLGMVLKEDDQGVTIQTGPADSLIQTLKKSDIRQRRAQASSPMPVGLLNALSKEQILDLLAFLESGAGLPLHVHTH